MRNLIVPFAGQSSRYTTPKFLLKGINEFPMVFESIRGLPLDSFDRIIFVYQKKHQNDYKFVDNFKNIIKSNIIFNNIELHELGNQTNSPVETICQTIKSKKIKGSLFIKDCDDYFKINKINDNQIAFYSLNNTQRIYASNKSYIKMNSNKIISTIVEKNVISPYFCCGLYAFKDSQDFCNTYHNLNIESEIYVSHIIYKQILEGVIFKGVEVKDYIDWGTEEDWNIYNNKNKTIK